MNRLLADDSHEMSNLIFLRKVIIKVFKMLFAVVVVGSLRVNNLTTSAYLTDLF